MANKEIRSKHYFKELQLFIEELCCTLYRFQHTKEGLNPDEVKITRKYDLGSSELFAGVMVRTPNQSPYFIEVQYGRSPERICSLITEKYAQKMPNVEKVVEDQTSGESMDKKPMKFLHKTSKKPKYPTFLVELDRTSDVPVLL